VTKTLFVYIYIYIVIEKFCAITIVNDSECDRRQNVTADSFLSSVEIG